ncbi:LysR family transcriptional regulator [Glaesserella parasuis]|nr:LysR family transcriptional regulator [Glaesserella parasuis]MDP0243405.1 LysR family transcriptional regulator [Glaesserella parasuis]
MNLNALSLFVSVVQDGSLSKASERLNVPIATISRQITELEKSLNIQLFDRKKNQALNRQWQGKSFMSKCIKTSIIYCK